MSDFDTEDKPKRTRKPSEPKPVYVLYRMNDEGNNIDVVHFTKSADEVLETIGNDATIKHKVGRV